jgi:hypothetical protein
VTYIYFVYNFDSISNKMEPNYTLHIMYVYPRVSLHQVFSAIYNNFADLYEISFPFCQRDLTDVIQGGLPTSH